jgi:hypothetical protein
MSGVAGRSGRKMFVPIPEQRNNVRILVGLGKAYARLRPKVPAYIFRLAERMKLRYR